MKGSSMKNKVIIGVLIVAACLLAFAAARVHHTRKVQQIAYQQSVSRAAAETEAQKAKHIADLNALVGKLFDGCKQGQKAYNMLTPVQKLANGKVDCPVPELN